MPCKALKTTLICIVIMGNRYIVIDIETLHSVNFPALRLPYGFKPWTDDCWTDVLPAQVCALKVDDRWNVVDSMSVVVKPEWYGATLALDNPHCKLTPEHFNDLALPAAQAVTPTDLFTRLNRLSSDVEVFVGYNVDFDMGVLRHHAAKLGKNLPDIEDWCVMDDAAKAMGKHGWAKLTQAYESICKLKVDETLAHDAAYDAQMTLEVAKALYNRA